MACTLWNVHYECTIWHVHYGMYTMECARSLPFAMHLNHRVVGDERIHQEKLGGADPGGACSFDLWTYDNASLLIGLHRANSDRQCSTWALSYCAFTCQLTPRLRIRLQFDQGHLPWLIYTSTSTRVQIYIIRIVIILFLPNTRKK
jgi:hypothetical protein